MRATRASVVLLAPRPVERATVLGDLSGWAEPLREFGIDVVDGTAGDIVIAPKELADAVAASDASTAFIVGRPSVAALHDAGFQTERLLPVPSLAAPTMLVSLARPRAARYGLSRVSVPSGRAGRARNRVAAAAAAAGLPMPGEVTLAHRGPLVPHPVRTAQGLGLPDALDWVLVLGQSTERPAFLLFERGGGVPRWMAKLGINRTGEAPDERGLAFAAAAGGLVSAHAPASLGSATVLGRPMSVETAAPGSHLLSVLRASGSRRRARLVVEEIADWLVAVAAETREPARLGGVLDRWMPSLRFPPSVSGEAFVEPLRALPATLSHSDLGPEHVIVDGRSFVVIDWEGAERHGLPLADIAYFLARVLPILDGEADDGRYSEGEVFARLFRGESASSGALRRWLARACDASGVPEDRVGRLLQVVWLTFADEHRSHFAEMWFSDSALGSAWSPS